MALLLLGAGAILALAAFAGSDASLGLTAAGVAFLVLTLGITSVRYPKESFHWAVPSLVRIGEYATLAWLAATADALPAAFALIAALTFRHYDLVYRLRHRAEVPPALAEPAGRRLGRARHHRLAAARARRAAGGDVHLGRPARGRVRGRDRRRRGAASSAARATAGEFDELEGEGE